jgi:hypothetical protein
MFLAAFAIIQAHAAMAEAQAQAARSAADVETAKAEARFADAQFFTIDGTCEEVPTPRPSLLLQHKGV